MAPCAVPIENGGGATGTIRPSTRRGATWAQLRPQKGSSRTGLGARTRGQGRCKAEDYFYKLAPKPVRDLQRARTGGPPGHQVVASDSSERALDFRTLVTHGPEPCLLRVDEHFVQSRNHLDLLGHRSSSALSHFCPQAAAAAIRPLPASSLLTEIPLCPPTC